MMEKEQMYGFEMKTSVSIFFFSSVASHYRINFSSPSPEFPGSQHTLVPVLTVKNETMLLIPTTARTADKSLLKLFGTRKN